MRRLPIWSRWLLGALAAIVVLVGAVGATAMTLPLSLAMARAVLQSPFASVRPQLCAGAHATDVVPQGSSSSQFLIRPMYAEALRYAQDAAGQPPDQQVNLWAVDVMAPVPLLEDLFSQAVGDVSYWRTTLSRLNAADFRCVVQDMQRSHVATLAFQTLQRDAAVLPGPITHVYLIPWYTTTFSGASTENAILIPYWELQPLNRALPRDGSAWSSMAPWALDHEYLEVSRYQRLGEGNAYLTLLGNLVTDGMADSFAAAMEGQTAYADFLLLPDQERALWARIAPTVDQVANPLQRAVMLGDPAHGIPTDAGYCIGYHIVQGYLTRHPGTTFPRLAGMDAETIVAGSGYNG